MPNFGYLTRTEAGQQRNTRFARAPDTLAGLVQWLDASDASTITLNGSTVSELRDKSGAANHASQATATKQPLYVTAARNGLNALRFDASDDGMGTLLNLPRPFTLMVCGFQNAASAGNQRWVQSGGNNSLIHPFRNGNNFHLNGGDVSAAKKSGTGFATGCIICPASGTARAYLDAADVTTFIGRNADWGVVNLAAVGTLPNEAGDFDCCEVVAYSAVKSADEIAQLHRYFAKKWTGA